MTPLLAGMTATEVRAALNQVVDVIAKRDGKTVQAYESAYQAVAQKAGAALPAQANSAALAASALAVLDDLLTGTDDFLRSTAHSAVLAVKGRGNAHSFLGIALTLGGVAFALGLLGKVKYSKEDGWELEGGFPGLEKATALINALYGHGGKAPADDKKEDSTKPGPA